MGEVLGLIVSLAIVVTALSMGYLTFAGKGYGGGKWTCVRCIKDLDSSWCDDCDGGNDDE